MSCCLYEQLKPRLIRMCDICHSLLGFRWSNLSSISATEPSGYSHSQYHKKNHVSREKDQQKEKERRMKWLLMYVLSLWQTSQIRFADIIGLIFGSAWQVVRPFRRKWIGWNRRSVGIWPAGTSGWWILHELTTGTRITDLTVLRSIYTGNTIVMSLKHNGTNEGLKAHSKK